MKEFIRNFGSLASDYTRFEAELQAMDDEALEDEHQITAKGDFPYAKELHNLVDAEVTRRSQQQ